LTNGPFIWNSYIIVILLQKSRRILFFLDFCFQGGSAALKTLK